MNLYTEQFTFVCFNQATWHSGALLGDRALLEGAWATSAISWNLTPLHASEGTGRADQ